MTSKHAKQHKNDLNSNECPGNITTFFSPVIPEEVKSAIPVMHILNDETLRSIMERCFDFAINAIDCSNEDFLHFSKSIGVSPDQCSCIITAFQILLRTIIKNKIFNVVVIADLKSMNVPEFVIDFLVSQLKYQRLSVERSFVNQRIRFPNILKFKWRIDITISTGFVSRVMRPSIFFQVIISNLGNPL